MSRLWKIKSLNRTCYCFQKTKDAFPTSVAYNGYTSQRKRNLTPKINAISKNTLTFPNPCLASCSYSSLFSTVALKRHHFKFKYDFVSSWKDILLNEYCRFGFRQNTTTSFSIRQKISDGQSIATAITMKDKRANAKLQTLLSELKNADKNKDLYLELKNSKMSNAPDVNCDVAYSKWKQSERELSTAYEKAIKYIARTNEKDSALSSQLLLEEVISRAITHENQKQNVEYNHEAFRDNELFENSGQNQLDIKTTLLQLLDKYKEIMLPDPHLHHEFITPPQSRKVFHDVLHAWANSKVKQKGFKAEYLLIRMTELNIFFSNMFDTMPDSKAFALAIKCHSGSTHKLKSQRILDLNDVYTAFLELNVSRNTPNDPSVLIQSIKSLKNYDRTKNAQLAQKWFSDLHSSLMQSIMGNSDISKIKNNTEKYENDDVVTSSTLDVTGVYLSVIRSWVNSKRKDSTTNALDALEKMHELQNSIDASTNLAKVRIESITYNLILSSYVSDRTNKSAVDALELFKKMLHYSEQVSISSNVKRKMPTLTELSFDLCIRGMSSHSDKNWVFENSQYVVQQYENMFANSSVSKNERPSNAVHNSLIKLYTKTFASSPDLLPRVLDVMKRMKELSKSFSEIDPDSVTYSYIILACSLAPSDDASAKSAMKLANTTFTDLLDKNTGSCLKDISILHMMQCVLNQMQDADTNEEGKTKKEVIENLFALSCERGLVSYDVLQLFKSCVSKERFIEICGDGRLADNWVANVTSKKAFYTDGSLGGAGKNARRKGKSTSDWVKKNRIKIEMKQARHRMKQEKKMKRKQQKSV